MKPKLWIIIGTVISAMGFVIGILFLSNPVYPTHYSVEIHGMKDTYSIGEQYSFYYTMTGYGNMCGFWAVSFPDQNGVIQNNGAVIDCTHLVNKKLDYDSRKENKKFTSIVPSIPGKYNVTVYTENTKPIFYEFTVTTAKNDFNYDIEYDDLVTRKVWAFAIPAGNIIPEQNCHKFTAEERYSLPQGIKYVIDESIRGIQYDEPEDGFYAGFANPIKFDEAKQLLEQYDFSVTQKPVHDKLNHINDTTYHFECIFEDEKYQYKLGFDFDSHYAKEERIVFVNIAQDSQGNPVIDNNNTRIFSGGFNGTIVFNNKLDNTITIRIVNPRPGDTWTENLVGNSMTIPPSKAWSISPRNWNATGDLTYYYSILPENLNGTFTLKSYPQCMTKVEIESLYSQVNVFPKFPKYLPSGSEFECGVHNMNNFVHYTYVDTTKMSKDPNRVRTGFYNELPAAGGIVIDYLDGNALSFPWYEKYDKFSIAIDNRARLWSMITYIDDNPTVLSTEWMNYGQGNIMKFNKLELYMNDQEIIRIKSSLPFDELVKIATSMIEPKNSQNKPIIIIPDGSSSTTSEKSFEPRNIKVIIGLNNTIVWQNRDDTPHTIELDYPEIRFNDFQEIKNSDKTIHKSMILPNGSIEFTFTKPGAFGYHSVPWMKGTIVVLLSNTVDSELDDVPLEINTDKFKKVYKINEPIIFDIFAKGHVQEYSFPRAIVANYDNQVIWESNDLTTIGGPEIGYVSYRWFSEDLGTPIIKEPGKYKLVVWWLDKSIEHEFTVIE